MSHRHCRTPGRRPRLPCHSNRHQQEGGEHRGVPDCGDGPAARAAAGRGEDRAGAGYRRVRQTISHQYDSRVSHYRWYLLPIDQEKIET